MTQHIAAAEQWLAVAVQEKVDIHCDLRRFVESPPSQALEVVDLPLLHAEEAVLHDDHILAFGVSSHFVSAVQLYEQGRLFDMLEVLGQHFVHDLKLALSGESHTQHFVAALEDVASTLALHAVHSSAGDGRYEIICADAIGLSQILELPREQHRHLSVVLS